MKHVLALSLAVAFMFATAMTASADPDWHDELAQVRRATAQYHDIANALADGYVQASGCVPGMGYHYVNFALDGTTALAPNVLLYAPTGEGKLTFVAVEYVVFSETLTVAPTIFGQTYFGPMTHGIPRHFERHVWLWLGNPDGVFSQTNDRVTCP
ncbi:MAG TPA: hypothetical protein VFM93_13115 [Candidatus Limnocylindria bacterium]|nr:hypothetical protein [Candidatus Limnocylindria bacterium]